MSCARSSGERCANLGAAMSRKVPAIPGPVARVFDSYAPKPRRKLRALRKLIYETASSLDGVGRLEETLKWGEPAYLTSETKSGSTIRLGWKEARADECFMYFNCQTSLVPSFRDWFSEELVFEKNRAIVFRVEDPLPADALVRCIEAALTYHRRKA